MVLIKVQFDAYNRQFKLLDRELVHALEDGETYVLLADVSVEDLKLTAQVKREAEVLTHTDEALIFAS
jgi:hypothetical protein